MTRRQFFAAAANAIAAMTLVRITPLSQPQAAKVCQLDLPASTLPKYHFQQQIADVPHIIPDFWALWVYGFGRMPQIVTYNELLGLDSIEIEATLVCAGKPTELVGTALWRGVPLKPLLEIGETITSEVFVRFDSADGYATSIPLIRLDDSLLAYEMNRRPLPAEHGFPVRLIVPNLYGYKMPKWIQRISLTETPFTGFWESRGWPHSGEIDQL